jgi:hypothetical protein
MEPMSGSSPNRGIRSPAQPLATAASNFAVVRTLCPRWFGAATNPALGSCPRLIVMNSGRFHISLSFKLLHVSDYFGKLVSDQI